MGDVSYPPGGEYVCMGIPPGGQLAAGGGPHCSLRGQQLEQPASVAPTTATAIKPSSLVMTSLPVNESNQAPGRSSTQPRHRIFGREKPDFDLHVEQLYPAGRDVQTQHGGFWKHALTFCRTCVE